jgi:lysophospholipase L1-like esterase
MRKRLNLLLKIVGCAVAAAAIAGDVVLYRQATRTYVELQRVRLDPTGSAVFEAANRALAPAEPGRKRVIYFGDSRIAMWEDLPKPGRCQAINRGMGSETTAQLLMRLDRDVLALRPDVVVIEMGVNDLKNLGVFPDRQQQIIDRCTQNTDLLIERLAKANVRVLILTIFPVGDVPLIRRPLWSDKSLDAIAAFNRRLRSQKDPRVVVVDCDITLSEGGRMKRVYALDTLHLTAQGYQALNQLIEPVLAASLETLPEKK